MVLVAIGGLVIGVGAVWVARALKWPRWSVAGLAFGGYVLAVVPLAVPSAMTDPGRIGRGTLNGVGGIVTSWKQLLTVSLPAGNYQGVLIPFFIVVLIGSLTATSARDLAKRGRAVGRGANARHGRLWRGVRFRRHGRRRGVRPPHGAGPLACRRRRPLGHRLLRPG